MVTPRPLDPLRSIKAKLGVLVAVTVAVSSFFVWYGLVHLDWRPRYTLPVAVLLALGVTQVLARGMTSPLRSMTACRGKTRRKGLCPELAPRRRCVARPCHTTADGSGISL